jgi:hypothetical protein
MFGQFEVYLIFGHPPVNRRDHFFEFPIKISIYIGDFPLPALIIGG